MKSFLFVALACLALTVAAQSQDNLFVSQNPRALNVTESDHDVFVVANSKGNMAASSLMFDFTTMGFPRLRVARVAANFSLESGPLFSYRIGFHRLVEFIDNNNDTYYDANDVIVSEYSLVGYVAEWSSMLLGKKQTFAPGLNGNSSERVALDLWCTSLIHGQANANTTLPNATLPNATIPTVPISASSSLATNFTICLEVANDTAIDADGYLVGPTRPKLKFFIDNFNFTRPNTRLAVLSFISSIKNVVNASDLENAGANASTLIPNAFYVGTEGALIFDAAMMLRTQGSVTVSPSFISPDALSQGEQSGNQGSDDDIVAVFEDIYAIAFAVPQVADRYEWAAIAAISDSDAGLEGSAAASAFNSGVIAVAMATAFATLFSLF